MLINDKNFQILEDLLNVLDNKDPLSLDEMGMRDILEAVVKNDYVYIKEVLEDYK